METRESAWKQNRQVIRERASVNAGKSVKHRVKSWFFGFRMS